jgi:hypothetical protein
MSRTSRISVSGCVQATSGGSEKNRQLSQYLSVSTTRRSGSSAASLSTSNGSSV